MLFVRDDELENARRDRSYPRGDIWRRIKRIGDRLLDVSVDDFMQLRRGGNLFRWDKALSVLGAVDAVEEGGRYLDHALTLTTALENDRWRRANLDGHIRAPWVLTSVALLYDLHRGHLDDDARRRLEGIVEAMGSLVESELQSRAWGDPARMAWNHPIIGYSSLGIAALVLDSDSQPDAWIELSSDAAERFLATGLSRSGMTWEGLSYCGFVFRHLGVLLRGFRNASEHADLAPAGSNAEARLRQVPTWFAHEVRPGGGSLQDFNDSPADPHLALLGFLRSFATYEPDLCASVWERLVGKRGTGTLGHGPVGTSLAEALFHFPLVTRDVGTCLPGQEDFVCREVGYVSSRDAWTEHASVFSFNAGPYASRRHDHSDNNSFTLILDGNLVVMDSGPGGGRREGNNTSSWGHNLVFIDGLAQRACGKGRGVSGELLSIDHGIDHTAVIGDATASYNENGFNAVRHAHRHALFVKRPVAYLVTFDDIDKDGDEHLYQYALHLPQAERTSQVDHRTLLVKSAHGSPTAAVRVLEPRSVEDAVVPRPGLAHGSDHELWMLGVSATNPRFVVLITPPGLTLLDSGVVISGRGVQVRLEFEHGMDEVMFFPWNEHRQAPILARGEQ